MASKEIMDLMEPMVFERDRQEFALGDTFDIKTGLILAALTFLAIQSGEFIHGGLSFYCKVAQYVSVGALIIGGILATIELWPIDYEREASPDKYLDWLERVKESFAGQPEVNIAQYATAGRLERALERIKNNVAANKRKSGFMIASFAFIVLSFAANMFTLFMRLLS